MREGLCDSDDWNAFNPKTNVYWIEYLIDKLVSFKMVGKLAKEEEYVKELEEFGKRVAECQSSIDVLCDDFLWECVECGSDDRENVMAYLRSAK
jgi:hypothetical protein